MIQWREVFNNQNAVDQLVDFVYYNAPFKQTVQYLRDTGCRKVAARMYSLPSNAVRSRARKALSRRWL